MQILLKVVNRLRPFRPFTVGRAPDLIRTRSLKIEEICKFDDESPLDALAGNGVARIIVNDVQVA